MSENERMHLDVEDWKRLSEDEMPDDVVLWKDVGTAVKAVDVDAREITIAYSTESVDRDGDVIRQKGIDLKAYRKNPVVLFAHASRNLPIARSMKLLKSEDGLRSLSVDRFTEPDVNALGDTVFRMMSSKPAFLNAASIGFRPLKTVERELDEAEQEQYWRATDFVKVEKLEHSIVPVPANSEALQGAKSVGIDLGPIKVWAEEILDNVADDLGMTREHLERCYRIASGRRTFSVPDLGGADQPEVEIVERDEALDKGSVPSDVSTSKAPEDEAWRAPTLSQFAGEGPFEDRPAAQRRRVAGHYAWAESMPPTAFGQLKLPHHRASDGNIVLRGVMAAMGALLGARGGVNIPSGDRRKVYGHLAKHYRAFDREAPEFRDYDADEFEEVLAKMMDEAVIKTEVIEPEPEEKDVFSEAADGADDAVVPVEEGTHSVAEDVDGEEKGDDDEADGFEFPSIKEEGEAAKADIGDQVSELREGFRTMTGLLKQVVGAIKVAGSPEREEPETPVEEKDLGDEVVLLLADDEPEAKEEPSPGNEVGRFIAEETAKAVTGAFNKHTGRLPN